MIRTILFFTAIVLCSVTVKAQMPLSFGAMNGGQVMFQHFRQMPDTNQLQKKWFVTKYASLSTGFVGFRGGSATYLSAPVGVQLNRQLTNNLYAFAGLELAPTYLHYNSMFSQPGLDKSNGFMNANHFSTYTTARMGLMYVNPERTFSISGSIGVSRRNFGGYAPVYAPTYNPAVKH